MAERPPYVALLAERDAEIAEAVEVAVARRSVHGLVTGANAFERDAEAP